MKWFACEKAAMEISREEQQDKTIRRQDEVVVGERIELHSSGLSVLCSPGLQVRDRWGVSWWAESCCSPKTSSTSGSLICNNTFKTSANQRRERISRELCLEIRCIVLISWFLLNMLFSKTAHSSGTLTSDSHRSLITTRGLISHFHLLPDTHVTLHFNWTLICHSHI